MSTIDGLQRTVLEAMRRRALTTRHYEDALDRYNALAMEVGDALEAKSTAEKAENEVRQALMEEYKAEVAS